MPNLTIVNTDAFNIHDIGFRCLEPMRADAIHLAFFREVRKHHPGFRLPYMSWNKEGIITIPLDQFSFRMNYITEGEKVTESMRETPESEFKDVDLPLADYIAHYANPSHPNHIETIVEFSRESLYPQAMRDLEARFAITRYFVGVHKQIRADHE